jgi:hypothetical protein
MKPEPVWILEAGGSLMVLSTTERDRDASLHRRAASCSIRSWDRALQARAHGSRGSGSWV